MKRILACLVFLAAIPVCGLAQITSQSFNLQAGWNSIWLELNPTNTSVDTVFRGLPVDSVWTFARRLTAVDYIQDASEPVWNSDQWLVYIPTNRLESINNNLFEVYGLRAYLIKLTAPATLTIIGRPSVRNVSWVPDAYNLRGYPVDPAAPPTFFNFFRYSSAHYQAVSNRLERIYKLNATGSWILTGPGELIQRGVAYWTYCRGGSDYQAPLSLQADFPDGLDFADGLEQLTLSLVNRMSSNVTATIRDLAPTTPLAYARPDPAVSVKWVNLGGSYSGVVPTGQSLPVRLALQRGALSQTQFGSLLEVKNGLGVRWLLPVEGVRQPAGGGGAPNYAGLWAGVISVNAVNEVNNSTNAVTPTPVSSEFSLRLLLHVDQTGVIRLLREVTQLWRDGTTTNNAAGLGVVATPGRYLLVTDERLIPGLRGTTLRDGQLAGRRLSTSGFDFPTSPDANFLRLSGSFGLGGTISGSFSIPPTFARNPFYHRYHPDHDNLDVDFRTTRLEAYDVTRAFELRLSPTNLVGATTADYGYKMVAGTYRETVTGLNKSNLVSSGTFRLNRVSEIGTLNQ